MTDLNVINAEIREGAGKGASRRLRHQGKVPAVIYGGHRAPATLAIEHGPLKHATERESFFSSILEIKVGDGRVQKVVVRDIQHHPYRAEILHLDFMRVSAKEVLRMSVPIHFTGEDESEAGRASGVVIQHLITEVEIEALPGNLPSFLAVDLSGMETGDVIMLTDVQLPDGVQIPALGADGEGDVMIANTSHIKESQGTGAAAEAEAAAEAAAEAEVIGIDEAEADDTDDIDAGDTEEDQS